MYSEKILKDIFWTIVLVYIKVTTLMYTKTTKNQLEFFKIRNVRYTGIKSQLELKTRRN